MGVVQGFRTLGLRWRHHLPKLGEIAIPIRQNVCCFSTARALSVVVDHLLELLGPGICDQPLDYDNFRLDPCGKIALLI